MSMHKRLFALILTLAIVAGGLGCSNIPFMEPDEEPVPTHVHFEDVLIPAELDLDRKESFVFETEGFKAGTLYFKGYVDPDSITEFFRKSMPNDGWILKSIFRHPKTVLLFEKERKSCIIVIFESTIYTHVEIWVAPQI